MDWLFLLPLALIGLSAWSVVRKRRGRINRRRLSRSSGDSGSSYGDNGASPDGSDRHHGDGHSSYDSGGDSGGGGDGGGGGD
ncbi:hypothetical protein FF80_01820 [Devosia sp. LC5]|uniref:hypothetical protein n=1 Tax=Devosia sp. LC5 TaxID=1502724 RepID=UPI0004E43E33|nr:hypothetical protein [Devosia sp. LC5]KFC68381.1 hypothetical protein FF80_01820 [Devosia sp. LC5]